LGFDGFHLHFGNPLHEIYLPYGPVFSTRSDLHSGHFSPVGFDSGVDFSGLGGVHLHFGKLLQLMNGPNLPTFSTKSESHSGHLPPVN